MGEEGIKRQAVVAVFVLLLAFLGNFLAMGRRK